MTLDEIDALVAEHRRLYLAAEWAGHSGEAEAHEMEVDRLLGDRWAIQRDASCAGSVTL